MPRLGNGADERRCSATGLACGQYDMIPWDRTLPGFISMLQLSASDASSVPYWRRPFSRWLTVLFDKPENIACGL